MRDAAGDLAGTATYSSSQTNSWTSFPVTNMVREWVAGNRPNYGFMLKIANETQVAGGPAFWAGEFPVARLGSGRPTRPGPRRSSHWQVIQDIIAYGNSRGVTVTVVQVE